MPPDDSSGDPDLGNCARNGVSARATSESESGRPRTSALTRPLRADQ